MAGLKRLVGVTLAIVIATALVIYVLRPAASPGTSNVVVSDPDATTGHPRGGHNLPPRGDQSQPPSDDGTCANDHGHGHGHGHGNGHDKDCGPDKEKKEKEHGPCHPSDGDKDRKGHRHGHDSGRHDGGKGDRGSHGDD